MFDAADYTERFGVTPNADETGRFESVKTAVVDMVGAYIRAKYPWPLDPVPDAVKNATLDIFRDELVMSANRKPSAIVKDRREDALSFLEKIAKGILSLDIGDTTNDVPTVGVKARDLVFTDTLLGQMP